MFSLRSRFLGLLTAGALLCGAAGAVPATASATIKLGVFNSGAPANATAVADYTTLVGRQPDIVMWYHDFGHTLLTSEEITTLRATGQAPMVTWEPHDQSLSSIASGAYDSYLRDSARIAKGFGGELMVRFAHEMNGDWYSWARSSSYVSAWQHIVSVFRAEGATNVRWVWAPNVDRSGSMPFSSYFPGEEWVDYIGLDGYNWGDTPGNDWTSLEGVFASSYDRITQLSSKPLIITETASSEVGGDKAEWIRTGFMKTIPQRFPRVTGVIWFNKAQEDNWPITSSQAALDAYREVVNCTTYGGALPCGGATAVEDPLVVESVQVPRRIKKPKAKPQTRGVVSYRLTDPAVVSIEVQVRTDGGSYDKRASLRRKGHRGRNRVPLRRLVRHRRLAVGHYRVSIVASRGDGRRSRPRRAHFQVVG